MYYEEPRMEIVYMENRLVDTATASDWPDDYNPYDVNNISITDEIQE